PAAGNVELGHPVGRTEDVVADPADPNVAFLAAADGGIWRTSNWLDPKGPTWAPRTSYQWSCQFGGYHDLAVAPSNHLVVYGVVSGPGAEILKSTDGGKTWLPFANAYFEGYQLSAVVVDPTNASIVYAAGTNGVHKSTDGGKTWTTSNGGVISGYVSDLVIDPKSP